MLNSLRPILKKILEPIAKKIGINPNIITLISLLIAILSAISIGTSHKLLGAVLILLSGFFDVLDGETARYHNKTSKFGAILDSTMDRFSDAVIVLGFIYVGYIDWFIGVLAIHAGFMVSYIRSSSEAKGISNDVGIAERAVRLIILMASLLVGIIDTTYIQFVVVFLVISSYFTVVQRLIHSWKHGR
ncbi:MAG: CDP-alcohol phosphatidyltransferase family protein [Methanobrevibacter sp.]|jgi:archaetidylinositol phosphate synthase|nr:CDP-alcohol phosphatidyltransferase family protein [Candidatus Methanovirga aequatorialis]